MNNPKTLLLPTCKGLECILFNEIVRIEASSNYSKLFFNNGKTLVVAKVLHWFEDKLPKEIFTRVHRSHLINMHYISHYCLTKCSSITLIDNSLIVIARRKKVGIEKILGTRIAA